MWCSKYYFVIIIFIATIRFKDRFKDFLPIHTCTSEDYVFEILKMYLSIVDFFFYFLFNYNLIPATF